MDPGGDGERLPSHVFSCDSLRSDLSLVPNKQSYMLAYLIIKSIMAHPCRLAPVLLRKRNQYGFGG